MIDARDAATTFARVAYDRESFEKYMDVTVVAVADDGTETVHLFTVDVEHEPVFRDRVTHAKPRRSVSSAYGAAYAVESCVIRMFTMLITDALSAKQGEN